MGVAGQIGARHVHQPECGQDAAGGQHDLAALQPQHFRHGRVGYQVAGFLHGLLEGEHRGLFDVEPHVEGDHDQRGTDQERNAPAPLQERRAVFADRVIHAEKGQAGQHGRGAPADQGEHAVPAAFVGWCVFGTEQRRAGPFATDGKPLQQSQDRQDQRRGHADRRCAGNHANRHRGAGHDQQRGDQRLLASQPIPVVAEHGRAQRAGQKRRGEGPHRRNRGYRGAEVREEHRGEHQRCGGAVDQEVVVLDRRADVAGQRHPRHRCGPGRGRDRHHGATSAPHRLAPG